MLKTALYEWHVAHHGRMVDFAGWLMPIQYTTITDEHHAVRNRAGLFDIAHMGRIKFTGPDAAALLDGLLTNNVSALKPGQIRYSLMCRESGGILDDVLVYRFDDFHLLVVNASNREKIVDWISTHRGDADVLVQDMTLEWFMFALQGPQALPLLQRHTDVDLGSMKYYSAQQTIMDGETAIISRTGYTGEDGFEVMLPASEEPPLWESLVTDGAEFGLLPCGLGCRDTLRLEAAMPLYGHELDEDIDPLTAGLDFGVKLDAGPFIGRDRLREIRDAGVTRRRVGLKADGKRIPREGTPVFAADIQIGTVTSGTFSPTLEYPIAMAYVDKAHATVGTSIEFDLRGKREPGEIVELPFYRRSRT